MPYSISISRSIYLDIDVDLIINIDIPLKPYSIPISISKNLDIVKYLVKIKNLDIVKILSRSCQYQDILPTSGWKAFLRSILENSLDPLILDVKCLMFGNG